MTAPSCQSKKNIFIVEEKLISLFAVCVQIIIFVDIVTVMEASFKTRGHVQKNLRVVWIKKKEQAAFLKGAVDDYVKVDVYIVWCSDICHTGVL